MIDYPERPDAVVSIYDLASGRELPWLPVATATADASLAVLEALFRKHGPPLHAGRHARRLEARQW